MASFTPSQMSRLARLIQNHFTVATLGQAVLRGLSTSIQTYSTGASLPQVILDLCQAVNREERVHELIDGLKASNPDATLREALDAFLGGIGAQIGVFDVLLITELPIVPMINRRSLRGHLANLLAPGSGYRAFSVTGPTGSGKTHSGELIRFVAKVTGATPVTITLVDETRTLSLRDVLNKLALSLRHKISDVSDLFLDNPTEAQATERFVDWLGGLSQAFQHSGEQYWLIFDGLDRSTALVFRELLVPQLLAAAANGNLHGITLFFLGDNAKRVGEANRLVLHEDTVSVREAEIRQFIEDYAASKGWLVPTDDLKDIMARVVRGAGWPYDRKAMEAIVARLVKILPMLSKPDAALQTLVREVL